MKTQTAKQVQAEKSWQQRIDAAFARGYEVGYEAGRQDAHCFIKQCLDERAFIENHFERARRVVSLDYNDNATESQHYRES